MIEAKNLEIAKAISKKILSLMKEKYISTELIRVGGEGDGGYLVPNILKNISYCYSPGVSFTASFEKELTYSIRDTSFK